LPVCTSVCSFCSLVDLVAEKGNDMNNTFKVHALRAIAHLYKSFPSPTTVEHSTLRTPPAEQRDGSVIVTLEDENGSEAGTILWLYRQGFIEGKLVESKPLQGDPSAGIINAQLTVKALRMLEDTDPNAGQVLGEYVVASAFGPEEPQAAELLTRRLLQN
jgi:hypothetical protein